MSHMVHVDAGGMRLPISRARVAEIARGVLSAERVRDALLSIAFVSDRAIAALHRRHLGRSGATDVISFGFAAAEGRPAVIGDVYIAPAVARVNARRHGARVRDELTRLVVHGVLHVVGHDHPDSEARVDSPMWRRQERLVSRFAGERR